MKTGIGIYGRNGHQITSMLENHPQAELVATAAMGPSFLPDSLKGTPGIRHYETLEEMLMDDRVKLVSLCSPRRRDQAGEAIMCLKAGKHVYAEKPCAMTEEDLDAIIRTSRETGMEFHEMAGTAFDQPYFAIRNVVRSGIIGEVVQVLTQKSYPYHDGRPQDENIDGGLICQVGVHAARFIEHVAGQRIKSIYAVETKLGNPVVDGNLRIAASLMMTLENGGVASMVANYLNPKGFGLWGNEHLRIFGTKGFVESVDGGARTRLVVGEKDLGPVDVSEKAKDYFDMYVDLLQGLGPMPFELEEELHPTRMVIRAKNTGILK
jgi:predicted dehydrogenase